MGKKAVLAKCWVLLALHRGVEFGRAGLHAIWGRIHEAS